MKVQLTCSDDMVSDIDFFAKQMSMSRSALCNYFIGQGLLGLKKGIEISQEYFQKNPDFSDDFLKNK